MTYDICVRDELHQWYVVIKNIDSVDRREHTQQHHGNHAI